MSVSQKNTPITLPPFFPFFRQYDGRKIEITSPTLAPRLPRAPVYENEATLNPSPPSLRQRVDADDGPLDSQDDGLEWPGQARPWPWPGLAWPGPVSLGLDPPCLSMREGADLHENLLFYCKTQFQLVFRHFWTF